MKIDYEYIKEYLNQFNYTLISDSYERSNKKLDMICNKGHECSISWDNFKYGRRCKTCASLSKANKFKLDYSEVKKYIESYGCKLLDKDYKNNSIKLHIKCHCGENFYMSLAKFKINKKCLSCKKLEHKTKKHSYSYISNFIENYNYKLISDTYEGADKKIIVQCPNGHPEYSVKFSNFHSGKRCPYCSNNKAMTLDEVKMYLMEFNYQCLSDVYKNQKQKLNIVCDNGHNISMTIRELKTGCRCKICGMSKGERRIKEFLDNNHIKYSYNEEYFRDLLSPLGNPLKPDFIIPNLKIWIEYDGEFHYEMVYNECGHDKVVIYDKLKDEYAKKHNWKLIRIPYWEFDNIEDILKKELKHGINLNDQS